MLMQSPLPDWALQMNVLGASKIPFLFILDFDCSQPLIVPLAELKEECIRFEINTSLLFRINVDASAADIFLEKQPVDFEVYSKGFAQVMKAIQRGDSYLLNLCYTTRLRGVDSLEEIFDSVVAPFKLLCQNNFVVFSPERFVLIEGEYIRTYPMKGTIDASIANAEEVLLNDEKEREEHATVVDLLRNDLSIVSEQVTVERYRYISRIHTAGKTLLQCSSEISGRLPENYYANLGGIFHALLPAGSVTGAPKKRTVELISEIELEPRGYYTGVFGVFDGANVDSAVMIRMIEQRGNAFYYRSGGGITYRSDVRQEYQEMIDKVYIPV